MVTPLLPTYARADIAFEKGEGAYLIATDGRRYLDFAAGIAVNSLGHCHPALVKALTEQANKLWHVSNLYEIPEGDRLAKKLIETTFADTVFFCNSGAEALEGSIKMARKYHAAKGHPERYRIITFEGAFHGRTLATLAAGGQKKYLEGFGPKVEGFDQVPFADVEAARKAIGPETAAILLEPVQGEGGIRPVPTSVLKAIRQLCDEHGLLMILDEVQSGVGRTGKLFAHEWAGITPDIMAVAKGIGGGFPLGAFLATEEAASGMKAGSHGSTFGGNPLAMAVGAAVLDTVTAPGFLAHVAEMGLLFKQRIAAIVDKHPSVISGMRGEGLMMGITCVVPNTDVVAACRDAGLLTVGAGDNVLRLVPPLTVTAAEVDEAVAKIDAACGAIEAKLAGTMARGAAE